MPDRRLWSLLPAAANGSLPRAAHAFLWCRNARCNVQVRALLPQRQRGCLLFRTVCALCFAKRDSPQQQRVPAELRPSQIMPRPDVCEQGRTISMDLNCLVQFQPVAAYNRFTVRTYVRYTYPCVRESPQGHK